MTNLSDLFPAGAGKQVSFTASGNVTSSGKPVVLNSDGTVSEVSQTGDGIGTPVDVGTGQPQCSISVYNATADRTLLIYSESSVLKMRVAQVSGTSITLGTAVTISTGVPYYTTACYVPDRGNDGVVICFYDGGTSTTKLFNTTITAGTNTVVQNTVYSSLTGITYGTGRLTRSSSGDSFVWSFRDYNNSSYGTCFAFMINSPTSIAEGSKTVFESGSVYMVSPTYDSTASKTLIAWRYSSGSNKQIRAVVGTESSYSVSFGSTGNVTALDTTYSDYVNAEYNVSSNKSFIAYRRGASPYPLYGVVATISGTSVTFGTENQLQSTQTDYPTLGYDPDTTKIYLWVNQESTNYLEVKEITFSGTDFTQSVWTQVGTNTDYYPGEPMNNAAYDTTADTFVFCAGWASAGSNETDVFTYQFAATNLTSTNFLGISDAAISSAASGNITMKGGIAATGLSSLTPASDYYVQDDGTITTVSSSVKAGKALSATAINLEYQS